MAFSFAPLSLSSCGPEKYPDLISSSGCTLVLEEWTKIFSFLNIYRNLAFRMDQVRIFECFPRGFSMTKLIPLSQSCLATKWGLEMCISALDIEQSHNNGKNSLSRKTGEMRMKMQLSKNAFPFWINFFSCTEYQAWSKKTVFNGHLSWSTLVLKYQDGNLHFNRTKY